MTRLFFLFICSFISVLAAFEAKISSGVSRGTLKWALGDPSHEISTISALEWKGLEAMTVGAEVQGAWYQLEGNYGKIFSGTHFDSDYGMSKRERLYHFFRAKANKGELFDISAAVGWPIKGAIEVKPLFGYALDEQHLRQMSPGTYSYYGPRDPYSPSGYIIKGARLLGLHSDYRAMWHGPWAGAKLFFDGRPFLLNFDFEYHWLCYHGRGNWNLREDIAGPFYHYGRGEGIKTKLEIAYPINDYSCVGLCYVHTDYQLRGGFERFHYYGVSKIFEGKGILNAASWRNHALSLTYEGTY